jgi:hypothetical protein
VVITSVLFASYHLYQGIGPVIGHVGEEIVLGVAVCLTRRLWPLCVAHALTNLLISV